MDNLQEMFQKWEKENNPFYPQEMKYDRLVVNEFLKHCNLAQPDSVKPLLSDVLAEIKEEGAVNQWHFISIREDFLIKVLSKYFT